MTLSEELIQRGFQPTSKIIFQKIVDASEALAARFDIKEHEPLFQLNRVRLANVQPVAVEYASLNLQLFPSIEQENFESQSLFAVIRNRYGVYPTWAEAEIEALAVLP